MIPGGGSEMAVLSTPRTVAKELYLVMVVV
jgi:hypothetical protein